MPRRYQLKRRAKRQEETRRRIVEATVELHGTIGPAQTTISAIAERAGVQRLTVYRHFPDDLALFSACSQHFAAANPAPDPEPWREIADPVGRLRHALVEVYEYYRRTEPMMTNVLRDASLKPILHDVDRPFIEHWERMRHVLAQGWEVPDRQRALLLAALGHALDFQTWQSLVRQQELDDDQAIHLMVRLVCGVSRHE